MLRYRCLVLDHDDTVVRSAETVNYPQFLQLLTALRPGRRLTLEANGQHRPGVSRHVPPMVRLYAGRNGLDVPRVAAVCADPYPAGL